uniref:C-type lectin domain-containing protein n=1 Tax=Cyprinus carpio TaxID=7962 RepID=A0A8C2I1F2_CYPCA
PDSSKSKEVLCFYVKITMRWYKDDKFISPFALSSSVNSYVFYFIPNNMIWTEAQTYCRKHHTDLATVNDKTDLDELLKTLPKGFKSNIWIGLYRTNAQPPWVFSDGSHSLFRPWLSGQPNNYDGIQHCVYTDPNGYWNDWTCTDQFHFLPNYPHIFCKINVNWKAR